MKKIRSYTSIWSVEKVLYSINDFRLPFPITFTQMTWFVVSLFAVIMLCFLHSRPMKESTRSRSSGASDVYKSQRQINFV
ncbi:conjugal transfer protein [Enterococcus faecium]|nr:conjugal transfer protein [Enterococcus faecium]